VERKADARLRRTVKLCHIGSRPFAVIMRSDAVHAKAEECICFEPLDEIWATGGTPTWLWIGKRCLVEECVRPARDGIGDGNPNFGKDIGQGTYLGP
jgi:hypothetical protein